MMPELRHQLYQQVSAKNALINKYLKKIAAMAEVTLNLTMHISRHAFAHIAQEAGAESGAIKNILGHSNLATTERYMGSFDTSKSDNTLRTLFFKPKETKADDSVIELANRLKGLSPEQIEALLAITSLGK